MTRLLVSTVLIVSFSTFVCPQEAIDSISGVEEGIPIHDQRVRQTCQGCHPVDERGSMSRLSYRRTTPEGWQTTLRRMMGLVEVPVTPADARHILRYLSNNLGLAPEEARPAAFEVERRIIDHSYSHKETELVCTGCHSMGRVISQRRTRQEWELLIAMHRGYYPESDYQVFRRGSSREPERQDSNESRHPMEIVAEHLAEVFPLKTAEWTRWSAVARPPLLEGRWALSGYQLGKGALYGEVVMTALSGTEDEFETETRYIFGRSQKAFSRSGRAIVYTGFQWRGRSSQEEEREPLREVMFVESDWQQISGRWFTGGYDEFGMDIELRRVGNDPVILGVEPRALRASGSPQRVRIHGLNLSSAATPSDLDFGPGVEVTRVLKAGADQIEIEVRVAPEASVGARTLFLSGSAKESALVVYDRVDRLEVRPQAGLARVGGSGAFPKQYQQFEARAYHNGGDGQPGSDDDLDLGIAGVRWSLEEYPVSYQDDDVRFVGSLDNNGLFTPGLDGPNPERKHSANNIGDVWVVATGTAPGFESGQPPLRNRAHLVVTVPLYVKWDQPGVAP